MKARYADKTRLALHFTLIWSVVLSHWITQKPTYNNHCAAYASLQNQTVLQLNYNFT